MTNPKPKRGSSRISGNFLQERMAGAQELLAFEIAFPNFQDSGLMCGSWFLSFSHSLEGPVTLIHTFAQFLLPYVCLMFALYSPYVWLMDILYVCLRSMPPVFLMFALCLPYVCLLFVPPLFLILVLCLSCLCHCHSLCLPYVCLMFALCLPDLMFALCLPYVCPFPSWLLSCHAAL